jgi:hypothetical protein
MDRFVELQSIALNDPDPRIRLVAVRRLRDKRRSHADRLRDYVTHRGGELIRPGTFITRMPLFIAPTVGIGTPVKSRQWIRRLLEHIQQLVRQSSSRRMRRL